jgi:hypothetical protein
MQGTAVGWTIMHACHAYQRLSLGAAATFQVQVEVREAFQRAHTQAVLVELVKGLGGSHYRAERVGQPRWKFNESRGDLNVGRTQKCVCVRG